MPARKKRGTSAARGRAGVRSVRAKEVPSGPVTLDEARALARSAGAYRSAPKAAAPVSPVNVAFERRKHALEWEREKRRRIREYKATLAVMKRRGVKGLGPARRKGEPAAKARERPLQVFAEGDSWFDYPVPFFGGGIIPRLEDRIGVPILNLAKAGDEVRYMLGVEERELIAEQLANGCPAGGPWDAMLFSGGGNDIVDNPMALWIRDYDPALPPAGQIHQPRLDAALALVRAGYEDLISLRDRLSPSTHLVFHGYDYAIADGRGVCHHGPWLKPTFDLRRFPGLAERVAVTKVMLAQFAALLSTLEQANAKVTFVRTQGTLPERPDSWHNELHPSKAGFKTFAALFHQKLKLLFPTRVL
jgi:hypothetical protein